MTNDDADAVDTADGSDARRERREPDVLVRPKGYVESDPVVRRVAADLYIGNRWAAHPRHDDSFEFVLSATAEECPLTTHHVPLVDGPENEWVAFEDAVDAARTLYRRDGSVLIHCKAGISRSSTLIATTLAAEEGMSFFEALSRVQDARPVAMPHPALHELAVVYLAADG